MTMSATRLVRRKLPSDGRLEQDPLPAVHVSETVRVSA